MLQEKGRSRVGGWTVGRGLLAQMSWPDICGHTPEKRTSPVLSAARSLCAATISGTVYHPWFKQINTKIHFQFQGVFANSVLSL